MSMKSSVKIILFALVAAASIAMLLFAGCGDETPTTAFECDKSLPSLIPPSTGKPQHIYFYRDT